MKTEIRLIIWTLILAVFISITACNSNMAANKPAASNTKKVTVSAPKTNKSAESENPLGNVSFKRQSASKTIMYDPKGPEQSLSLTDQAGTTWTLILPPGALMESRKITMTALSDIKSDKLGNVLTGIELGPDDLEFLEPVEIRTENSKLNSKDIILSSGKDGKNLDFVEMNSNTALQGKLYHFSNKYATSRTSALDKILLKAAELRIKAAIYRAEALISQPIQVPTPPAIDLPEKCNEDEQKQTEISTAIENYLKEFKKPELEIIRELLAAMKMYEDIAKKKYDPQNTEIKKLIKRIHKKCDTLINTYQPQDKYFLPVGVTVLSTQREIAMFADGEAVSYFEAISNWGLKVIEKYIEDIRDKHLYSKIYPITWLGKQVSIIGGGSLPWDFGSKLFYKLGRVLNFRVEFTDSFTAPQIKFVNEGKIKNISVDVADSSGIYRGEGEGGYTKAIIEEEGVSVKQPNKFPVRAILCNFEPCHSDRFKVLITAFGPENDTIIANGYAQSVSGMLNGTTGILLNDHRVVEPAFLSVAKEITLHEFELALQDGNEVAGEKKINKSVDAINIDFKIKLVHTPLKTAE